MTIKPCPLCGATSERYERTVKEIDLVKCTRCGFVFTNLPDSEILQANAAWGDSVLNRYEKMQAGFDQAWFQRIATWLGRPGARVLDIGCGNGVLIDAFRRRGCLAEGLDPSDWARTASRRKGFVLHESYAEDEALPAGGYDVVTSTSTFEHIPKPVEHVRSLLRLVRPGGFLYLCGMPNYGSLAVLGGFSTFRHNAPPCHANFFTPRSLRAVFEHAPNADYIDSVRIRTYGVPEAYQFYSRITRWRAGRKGVGGPKTSGEGSAGWGAVYSIVASSYYLLGRPFQLGDKLEVVARRSATPWKQTNERKYGAAAPVFS